MGALSFSWQMSLASLNTFLTPLKVAIRNLQQAEAELRSPTDFLPDWLINPKEYEPLFDTSLKHANATPTVADEAQTRLPYFCVYL